MRGDGLFGDESVVPVVMFHTVGTESMDWEYRHIAEPVTAFELKVSALKKAGFNFIFWSELYDYMAGAKKIDLPAVVLTFDDGYLDNWVYVYPILKRYGAKGTIFMTTDFVDPGAECRPTIDDVDAGSLSRKQLRIDGFLNWEEMRQMEQSGVIDIQSHAKTHTWYFSGPNVVDFWMPDQAIHSWMPWNVRPDRKPFYLGEQQREFVPLGTPVYEHEKSLSVTRFFPVEEIGQEMAAYVRTNGGATFFEGRDWKSKLMARHSELYGDLSHKCRFENAEERKARMMDELAGSKATIESELDKSVDFMCWPGGGYVDETLSLARKAGYKAWTLSSRDQSEFRNVPGADPVQVKRIGSGPRQIWHGRDLGFTNGTEFLCNIRRHQGSIWHKWKGRTLRVGRIAGILS